MDWVSDAATSPCQACSPSMERRFSRLISQSIGRRPRPGPPRINLLPVSQPSVRDNICPEEKLLQNIDFKTLDMNNIDRDLDRSFDFCWSACALEHLGSIENGFKFIRNSLRTLKPCGVAVHTTEFTFDGGPTRDNNATVLFTKDKIVDFAERLRRDGFTVAELDFSAGDGQLDAYSDIPMQQPHVTRRPNYLHLKLSIDGYVCTSFGLVITVPGGQPS